jgi:hypothetical protein
MFRLKQLIKIYEQSLFDEAAAVAAANAHKKRKANRAPAPVKAKAFSPTGFVKWLGVHWAAMSKDPTLKECGVTHFFVKWLALFNMLLVFLDRWGLCERT